MRCKYMKCVVCNKPVETEFEQFLGCGCEQENEETLENRRIQASNICVDIFNSYSESESEFLDKSVKRAWEIGREIYDKVEIE